MPSAAHDGRKSGTASFAEKYVFNPTIRGLLRAGIAPRAFALLETTGRRTGQRRLTPVGNGLEGPTFWLVSAHGDRAAYVRNLLAHPRVRIKVRRRWYEGEARLVADDAWQRRARIDEGNGVIGRLDGKAFRAIATTPCTVQIDLAE